MPEVVAQSAASVRATLDAGESPTLYIFLDGTGTVPFGPANARVLMCFRDAGGVTRGSARVTTR